MSLSSGPALVPSKPPPAAEARRQPRSERAKRLSRQRLETIPWAVVPWGLIFLAAAFVALFAPGLVPRDPASQSLQSRLAIPVFLPGGNPAYLLGGDNLGRDVLSRMMMGSRVSMGVGLSGVVLGATVGVAVGLLSGYAGGWVDEALMTLGDIQLGFPTMLLAIAIIAVLGPNITNLIVVAGVTGWVTYARMTRSVVLKLRNEEFVQAVHAIGGTHARIVLRHILPNCGPVLIVLVTLELPRIIILESTLSFLGLGVQPPTPSWGGMISEGRGYLDSAWWIAVVPGTALLLTSLSISRLGDWLRSVLDPTSKRK